MADYRHHDCLFAALVIIRRYMAERRSRVSEQSVNTRHAGYVGIINGDGRLASTLRQALRCYEGECEQLG